MRRLAENLISGFESADLVAAPHAHNSALATAGT